MPARAPRHRRASRCRAVPQLRALDVVFGRGRAGGGRRGRATATPCKRRATRRRSSARHYVPRGAARARLWRRRRRRWPRRKRRRRQKRSRGGGGGGAGGDGGGSGDALTAALGKAVEALRKGREVSIAVGRTAVELAPLPVRGGARRDPAAVPSGMPPPSSRRAYETLLLLRDARALIGGSVRRRLAAAAAAATGGSPAVVPASLSEEDEDASGPTPAAPCSQGMPTPSAYAHGALQSCRLALRVRASSAASRPCAHHGRSHAGARLRRARRGARAAGRCRALAAGRTRRRCVPPELRAGTRPVRQAVAVWQVLRGPPRHAVPAKALVQATVFLLQRRALVALHTYVHCVAGAAAAVEPVAAAARARRQLFQQVRPMFSGEHHLEEIAWQEGIAADTLRDLLAAYDECVVLIQSC